MSRSLPTIGILGLGQIGGSIAMSIAASASGHRVLGYDKLPDLVSAARKRGIIDEADSVPALIAESDIVLLAVPVGDILEMIRVHVEALRDKLAVTDTGSVKSEIVDFADNLLLSNFVGGHPFAGTEKRGVESWNGDLFRDKSYFVTAGATTAQQAIVPVLELVRLLGANSVRIEAREHDRLIGLTSNLPHLLAYSLRAMYEQDSATGDLKSIFCGPSFAGATRVAASDPEMVAQMLRHNKNYLSDRLSELQRILSDFQAVLDRGRQTEFRRFLGC